MIQFMTKHESVRNPGMCAFAFFGRMCSKEFLRIYETMCFATRTRKKHESVRSRSMCDSALRSLVMCMNEFAHVHESVRGRKRREPLTLWGSGTLS